MTALILNIPAETCLSDEQFFQLCQANRDLRIERNANGDLVIMPPTGGNTSRRNSEVSADLVIWNRKTKLGVVFDSSGGFKLPNGAERSPDAAWVTLDRWNSLTPNQQERFIPLAPDFVIELRSPSDSLSALQKKMQEYIDNGTRLGWLLNRQDRQVEIYRPHQPKQVLQFPTTLSGEEVLPGLVLDLSAIW